MTPELLRVGEGNHPVVVVDGFSGDAEAAITLAAALAPFPPARGNAYPGLRRVITQEDAGAHAYAEIVLRKAAPLIGGAFDIERFDWIEASFSMVTTEPSGLGPEQRAPHFDAVDPGHIAILHYLCDTAGTAFYRQRETGIEQVDAANRDAFIASARRAAAGASGYIHGSDLHYEQIGAVEGCRDRLLIYRGSLLHSGIIPPGLELNPDPRHGRLTANLFVRGY